MPYDPDRRAWVANTIGHLIDEGHVMRVFCDGKGCQHHAQVDLSMLADRLGRDHSVLAKDLLPKMRCSQCGSKNLQMTCVAHHPGQMGFT